MSTAPHGAGLRRTAAGRPTARRRPSGKPRPAGRRRRPAYALAVLGGRRGALLLAAASLAVLVVAPALAQEASVEVSPTQGPPGQTVTVSASGFVGGEPCQIVWTDAGGASRVLAGEGTCAVNDDGILEETVAIPVDVARGAGTIEVCQQCDSEFAVRDTAPFRVVRDQTLTTDPSAAPVGAEVAVTGRGFTSDLALTLELDGQTVARLEAVGPQWSGPRGFETTITVPQRPGGAVTLRACQRCGTEFEVAVTTELVVEPSLSVEPDVAAPGQVVTVSGTGLPVDRVVTLRWQPGLGQAEATADGQGRLTAPLLVFHRDVTGPRRVVATVPEITELPLEARPGLSAGRLSLAEAELLVVPGTVQPSDFTYRR